MTFQVLANFTNPTNYTVTVPYFNINLLVNGTAVGQALAENIHVHPGNNTNVVLSAVWDPFTNGGRKGRTIGRNMLSQYISGMLFSALLNKNFEI